MGEESLATTRRRNGEKIKKTLAKIAKNAKVRMRIAERTFPPNDHLL
jgi:hypothetical protein